MQYVYKNLTISNLFAQLPVDTLKINQRSYFNLPHSVLWGWLSMESLPQNPEFRNNSKIFHPRTYLGLGVGKPYCKGGDKPTHACRLISTLLFTFNSSTSFLQNFRIRASLCSRNTNWSMRLSSLIDVSPGHRPQRNVFLQRSIWCSIIIISLILL